MEARKIPGIIIRQLFFRASQLVLGVHPNNTICSFNYHNVNHIIRYLKKITANLPKEQSILIDVGAGSSPYYFLFSSLTQEYIAIDTPNSLPQQETRRIRQISGFAESLPLDDSSADIVLCNQALEHVQDPVKAASEMYRVLKPGGKFIGSVPHISPVHLEPYDFRRYTDLGLEQLLKSAGFISIDIEGSGGVHSTAALMIAMDWMLTTRKANKPQQFSTHRALLLSPLVAAMNITGIILDTILGDKQRTPANLCWIAYKPKLSESQEYSF